MRFAAGKTRYAKVGYLNAGIGKQHYILRLYITVNNTLGMGVRKRAENLNNKVQRLFPAQWAMLMHIFFKGNAIDIFHYDAADVVGEADIVHLDDVGMGQHRNGFAFVFKTTKEFLVLIIFLKLLRNQYLSLIEGCKILRLLCKLLAFRFFGFLFHLMEQIF